MEKPISQEDLDMFCSARTSLDDIHAAGWTSYGSSSGSWWFRHEDGRRFLPHWILQIEEMAERRGEERIRAQIRHAMGMK
jgi:hypothetical protein